MNTDGLIVPLLRVLVAAPLVAAILYYAFGLNRTQYAGALFREQSQMALVRRLQCRYWLSAACAIWLGASVAVPRTWLLALPPGLVCGWLVATCWARRRATLAVLVRGGPEPSTPPEQRFPSDAGAGLLWSASACPLPMWLDVVVLIVCTMLGALIAIALA